MPKNKVLKLSRHESCGNSGCADQKKTHLIIQYNILQNAAANHTTTTTTATVAKQSALNWLVIEYKNQGWYCFVC